jgi:hypothetical protein
VLVGTGVAEAVGAAVGGAVGGLVGAFVTTGTAVGGAVVARAGVGVAVRWVAVAAGATEPIGMNVVSGRPGPGRTGPLDGDPVAALGTGGRALGPS